MLRACAELCVAADCARIGRRVRRDSRGDGANHGGRCDSVRETRASDGNRNGGLFLIDGGRCSAWTAAVRSDTGARLARPVLLYRVDGVHIFSDWVEDIARHAGAYG